MQLAKFDKNNAIINFLILGSLAVFSFGLGAVNIIFYAVAIIISLFSVFLAWKNFSKDEAKTLSIYAGIVFLFSAFYSFGNLYSTSNLIENIFLMLAINGALFLGIAARKLKVIKTEVVLMTIGVSVGLLLLISMIATWSQYGLFYRQIYSTHNAYYYDGVRRDLTNETMLLSGFKFLEAYPNAYCLFGVICFCFLPGCLFVKPKEKPAIFWIYFAVGMIGLLSIVTLFSLRGLLFLIPIVLVAILYKYLGKNQIFHKFLKVFLIVLASIFAIFFVFVIINAIGNNPISNLFASNALLNKLFNSNQFVFNVNKIINYLVNNKGFFGIKLVGNSWQIEEIIKTVYLETSMFEIEVLKESGVIAFVLLLAFIVMEAIMLGKYARKSNDEDSSKVIFLTLVIGTFLYCSFSAVIRPFPNIEDCYNGILRGPIPLLMLFLIGYTMITSNKKEPKLNENNIKENEVMEDMVL